MADQGLIGDPLGTLEANQGLIKDLLVAIGGHLRVNQGSISGHLGVNWGPTGGQPGANRGPIKGQSEANQCFSMFSNVFQCFSMFVCDSAECFCMFYAQQVNLFGMRAVLCLLPATCALYHDV